MHKLLQIMVSVTVFTLSLLAMGADKRPEPSPELLEQAPPCFSEQFLPRHQPPYYVPKSIGRYSVEDWQESIDLTWGSGLSCSDKIYIWDRYYDYIDFKFACFHNIDATIWDTVWNRYNQEITDTVSRGRFCAILEHASTYLRESHTRSYDTGVYYTELLPGVPLMFCGRWGDVSHFGAALTPLADSSLLVYKAVEPHPHGLEPGDIILGYDGIPWKELYPQLLAAELPITGSYWGSCEPSYTHSWLMAAGMNWHLYDTIDIIKYSSDDTLHLSTGVLVGQDLYLWGTEQMDVPGVVQPNVADSQLVSWGIIDGTDIGYIYGIGWFWNAEQEWYNAVDSLMTEHQTSGLIVDFRTNFGGNMYLSHPGLELLFNTTTPTVGFSMRCNTYDRVAMCVTQGPAYATIHGDPATYYDQPIAMLIGPGAVSSGDQVALALSLHPMVKVFGKPTAAAFNSPSFYSLHPSFRFNCATADAFLVGNTNNHLTHEIFPNPVRFPWVEYEEVWLTPDGVVQGRDDVVDAALAWIGSCDLDNDGYFNENDNCPDVYNPDQEDADNDGLGDSCDTCTDTDNDTYGDPGFPYNTCPEDNCPDTTNEDQTDTNGDGIGDACCCIERANVDGNNGVNVADLTYLVDYLFKGGDSPPCPEEGNVDSTGDINVADLTYLADYLFKGGTEPPPCP